MFILLVIYRFRGLFFIFHSHVYVLFIYENIHLGAISDVCFFANDVVLFGESSEQLIGRLET
jgi:hypothetical protein